MAESDTEKITINVGAVDLGKIDLLVEEGIYQNRTDLIRTAIRSLLDRHQTVVEQSVARNAFLMGAISYDKKGLQRMKSKGKRIKLTLIGMLRIAPDVPPSLAAEVFESLRVHGVLRASDEVKAALAPRMA